MSKSSGRTPTRKQHIAASANIGKNPRARATHRACADPDSAAAHHGLGDNYIHRDVEILRMDRLELRQLEADADCQWPRRERRQGAVEIAAAKSQPIAVAVEANEGHQSRLRRRGLTFFRDREVPPPTDECLARPPCPVFE